MTKVVKQAPDQYFQGILQLRNPREKVVDFIFRWVKKYAKKGVNISKVVKVRGGFDYYMSSNKFLRTLSNKLYSEFGGVVSLNEKLFSYNRQTGKNVYRLNVLFKVPGFIKGDVIEFKDKLILVKSVSKKVSGKDIIVDKKVSFKYSDDMKKIETYNTTVSRIKPTIEVLHPETYESVEVKNKKLPKLKLGEKVKVVMLKGVYVV